jgi:Tol biopolymer transport system component
MTIADRATSALIHTPAAEANARISPDGKWLAYQSNESGPFRVYVQTFPDATRRWQVSLDGGMAPELAPGGNELFYRKGPQMMAMTFSTGAEPALGHPVPLFDGDYAQSSTV